MEVSAEGAGPEGRDAKSSVRTVGGEYVVIEWGAGLVVEVGWVVSCLLTR